MSRAKTLEDAKHGDCVEFISPTGTKLTGQLVMKSALTGGWVVNTGGKYGTSKLVSGENYIRHVTLKEHNERIAGVETSEQ